MHNELPYFFFFLLTHALRIEFLIYFHPFAISVTAVVDAVSAPPHHGIIPQSPTVRCGTPAQMIMKKWACQVMFDEKWEGVPRNQRIHLPLFI